jgi:RND family efflux transporter MFP subunit
MTRLVVVTVILVAAAAVAARAASPGGPSVAVAVTGLHKGSRPRTVTAYGIVGAAPAARQTIQAPLAAIVDRVYAKPGEEVAARAPLLRLGPSPATASAYARAIAALRTTAEDVARTQALVGQHLATRQQLAIAEKSAADAQSALAALKAEGAGSAQTLRTPFAAIVTAVSASPGAIVAQGAPLVDLARPTELVLHAGVVPNRALKIPTGAAAVVMPLGGGQGAAGRVVLRGSLVDAKTGLVPIDVSLPAGRFFAGETAEASIVIGAASGYVVPHTAVLVDDRGESYVVQAVAGRAKEVRVHLELSDGATDVISGPLDPAAPLVLDGNYQLTNGMRIRIDPHEAGE